MQGAVGNSGYAVYSMPSIFYPQVFHLPASYRYTTCSRRQCSQQVLIILADPQISFAKRFDAPAGVQYRSMVSSTEGIPNFRQTMTG